MNPSGLFPAPIRLPSLPALMAGAVSCTIPLIVLGSQWSDPRLVAASIFFLLICATDTLQGCIPNPVSAALVLFGLGLHWAEAGWSGVGVSLTGLLSGGALLLPVYLLGKTGAGDVKALAAVGSLTGPLPVLHIFVYAGLIGGALALLSLGGHLLAGAAQPNAPHRGLFAAMGRGLRFPYAPAIALGYFAFTAFGGLV